MSLLVYQRLRGTSGVLVRSQRVLSQFFVDPLNSNVPTSVPILDWDGEGSTHWCLFYTSIHLSERDHGVLRRVLGEETGFRTTIGVTVH